MIGFVTVLEPVDTGDWTLKNVAPAARELRKRYLAVLGEDD